MIFDNNDIRLSLIGVIRGKVNNGRAFTQSFSKNVTLTNQQSKRYVQRTCEILDLEIGRIEIDLLGILFFPSFAFIDSWQGEYLSLTKDL